MRLAEPTVDRSPGCVMRLEAEGRRPVEKADAKSITATIARLKASGPCTFASVTNEHGSFVQVAGGQAACMIERRDASTGRHFRAYQEKRSQVFADGTLLVFGAGTIALQADEWFAVADAEAVFLAFLKGAAMPAKISWRDVTHTLG